MHYFDVAAFHQYRQNEALSNASKNNDYQYFFIRAAFIK